MFRVDYIVFAEEKWISDNRLPRHLDFPHMWTDVRLAVRNLPPDMLIDGSIRTPAPTGSLSLNQISS